MSSKNFEETIFIAGAGGQGILMLGKIIAQSAVEEDKFVTYYPTYGAEIRGGTANCSIRISNLGISSPVVTKPKTLIIMNQPSLIKFSGRIQKDSYLIIITGTEVVKIVKRVSSNCCISIPALEIAKELGDVRCANIVMLGAYIKLRKTISDEHVINTIRKVFENKPELIELNIKAFNRGNM